MTMLFRWYSMVNSYDKNYADFGNGVGIQTDNLRTADTDWFRTKGAVNNSNPKSNDGEMTELRFHVPNEIILNQISLPTKPELEPEVTLAINVMKKSLSLWIICALNSY